MNSETKKCRVCETPLVAGRRHKYCSPECLEIGHREYVRQYVARRRANDPAFVQREKVYAAQTAEYLKKARRLAREESIEDQVLLLESAPVQGVKLARCLGVSGATLSGWTRGEQLISGSARKLLTLMRDHPELVDEIRNA